MVLSSTLLRRWRGGRWMSQQALWQYTQMWISTLLRSSCWLLALGWERSAQNLRWTHVLLHALLGMETVYTDVIWKFEVAQVFGIVPMYTNVDQCTARKLVLTAGCWMGEIYPELEVKAHFAACSAGHLICAHRCTTWGKSSLWHCNSIRWCCPVHCKEACANYRIVHWRNLPITWSQVSACAHCLHFDWLPQFSTFVVCAASLRKLRQLRHLVCVLHAVAWCVIMLLCCSCCVVILVMLSCYHATHAVLWLCHCKYPCLHAIA